MSHEGHMQYHHAKYDDSMWNIVIEWENEDITSEPLSIIGANNSVACAIYEKENDELEKLGY